MRRARRHRPRHLPSPRRRPLGRRHDVGQRRAALRHAAEGAPADLQHPLQRLRAGVLLLRRASLYSRPIQCIDRDPPFVPDGVLYHESDLDLEEHYADTHGYTEINFAAFGMVGTRFCPRIRSLHRQRIYCADQGRDPRRRRAGPQARPAGGELSPHRRAVGSHRPVLCGGPRRPRHGLGRPAPAQPVPGLEPLLRRQTGARPGVEDRVPAAVHVRAATAGEGAAGPAQGRAAPRPGSGRLLRGQGRPAGADDTARRRPDGHGLPRSPTGGLAAYFILVGPADAVRGEQKLEGTLVGTVTVRAGGKPRWNAVYLQVSGELPRQTRTSRRARTSVSTQNRPLVSG